MIRFVVGVLLCVGLLPVVFGSSTDWVRSTSSLTNTDFCVGGVCAGNVTANQYNVSGTYAWFDFFCLSGDSCVSAWAAGSSDLDNTTLVHVWNTSWVAENSGSATLDNTTLVHVWNTSWLDEQYAINYNVTAYSEEYNVSYESIFDVVSVWDTNNISNLNTSVTAHILAVNNSQTAAELYNETDDVQALR